MLPASRLLPNAALAACSSLPGRDHVDPTPDLAYRFTLIDGDEPVVAVDLAFAGSDGGETYVGVNEHWGGVERGGEDVFALTAVGEDGRALEVERLEPWEWRVRHAPSERLSVRYELRANEHQAGASSSVHYRPILDDHLFHMIGELGLVMPLEWDRERERSLAFAWSGFDEAGWSVITSYAEGSAPLTVRTTLTDARHSLYVAGEVRNLRRDVHGRPLWVSVQGEWAFSDDSFADMAAEIVALERDFFGEYDQPFYWVSMIPVGEFREGSTSYGGTGLHDCFALFLSPGMTLEAHGLELRWLLAHEMFHEWNGGALSLAQPEPLGYWFSEGFTNFYARRLLYRAGVTDLEHYTASVNKAILDYRQSPARDASNAEIEAGFWEDMDLQRVPYDRGDLVAMMVDSAIRERTGGRRCLDDLMRDLVASGRAGWEASTEALIERFRAEGGDELAERVRRLVVEGGDPQLPAELFEPCLALTPTEVATYELGFDLSRTMDERVVHGVRAESKAFEAGLRDGQALVGMSIYHGNLEREVELQVREDDVQRTIRYLPHGGVQPVPQLRRREGGSADCDWL